MSEWEKWRDDIVLNFCDDHQFVALEATKDLLDAARKETVIEATNFLKDLFLDCGCWMSIEEHFGVVKDPTPPTAGEKE